ncbi:hypothetical protein XENTR_v10022848 [Xenopus tropicalis]|nr:hypothetical protein XENTR_v10022848 [Xenopus tropicalis]
MAAADVSDELSCPLCREIYTDPVTLPCGHNYCRGCIGRYWDWQEGIEEDLTCPECRHRYWGRPELNINVTLSSLVQRLLPTPPEQHGPGIYCTEYHYSPATACSTCLLCNMSLCYEHATAHSNITQHELTAPTPSQRDRHCPKHPELLLEYYCPQDGVCVCASCYRVGEHRDHRVETLSEASEKKKEKLREVLEKLSPEREETEGQIQRLQERLREVPGKAAGETERVTALFRGIRKWLEALEKQLLRDISWQQEKISLKLLELIHQLEIKKDELYMKTRHIEELCNMAAPLTVLQAREPDGAEFYEAEGGNRKSRKMEDINAPAVGDLDVGRISETLLTGLDQIVLGVKGWQSPGQEATDLVLDINTAGNYLSISGDRKSASLSSTSKSPPETPERFKTPQALSTRSFPSGRHYWEMEVSESGERRVGVAYPSMERDGEIGDNNKSWCLVIYKDKYSVRHRGKSTHLPLKPSYRRIRIRLDYEAGLVSFYELSEPIRHLHTFTASFTEPLHAAFGARQGGPYYCSDDGDEDVWVRIISKCSDSP